MVRATAFPGVAGDRSPAFPAPGFPAPSPAPAGGSDRAEAPGEAAALQAGPGWLQPPAAVPVFPAGHAATGAGNPAAVPGGPGGEIPGSLWLTVRDPQCLVAHWTFHPEDLHRWSATLGPGVWRLRVRLDGDAGGVVDRDLPGKDFFCFLPVLREAACHVVELGFDDAAGRWYPVGRSHPLVTPSRIRPVARTESAPAVAMGPGPGPDSRPPATGVGVGDERSGWAEPSVAPTTFPSAVPGGIPGPGRPASPGRLTRAVWREYQRSLPVSSGEGVSMESAGAEEFAQAVPEKTDHPAGEIPTGGGLPASAEMANAPGDGRRQFWMEVNAEVVLYGRTEPDARVTVAGREVRLRPDGSFSFRFLLPDGQFQLPVEGVAADGSDRRTALVEFARSTTTGGGVGPAPVDPALHPPGPGGIG